MTKDVLYQHVYNQLVPLLKKENPLLSKLSTIVALLHHKMNGFFWTGFYLLSEDHELWVGPYQGPVACQYLEKHKGVCWTAILNQKTIIVPNVHEFPGHIACDQRSNSEIAIPLFVNQSIIGVLDIDSKNFNHFDNIDAIWLEKILQILD
ncbi:MAG: GAF domain-containing protein [Bacteroidales bacterium]|nr:GAF domain-containing protein [Bacteroidales bacterium]